MRFAYADPPYPGCARYYGPGAREVNHDLLVGTLQRDFPDGWALSTSAAAIPSVLRLCPEGVRVAAWVKGPRGGVALRARSAWEPVIVWGGRARRLEPDEALSDALVWGGRQPSHPGAIIGMKPAAFCEWVFRLLGAQAGDALVDVFPGSGAVARAWRLYCRHEYARDASAGVAEDLADTSLLEERQVSARAPHDGWQAVAVAGGGDTSLPPRGDAKPSCLAGAERRLAEIVGAWV